MKYKFLLFLILSSCIFLLSPLGFAAEALKLLPFQGRLTDANGNALADDSKVVQFKIYDAPVGGQAVWSGEVQKLTVNGGLVSTTLGTKAGLSSVDFNKSLYLELTIDANNDGQITAADPPMLPRQSILPAVFAKESADSRLLDGYDWSVLFGTNNPSAGTILDAKIRDGSINAAKLQAGTITSNQIASQTITATQIAPAAITTNQLADGSVDASKLARDSVTGSKIQDGAVTSEKIKDGTITQADIGRIALPPPDYDSEWFPVSSGQSYRKILGFEGLPSLVVAYYRLPTGEVFPWGLNQYGDTYQGNGILLDFDELGNLYVRAPSGNGGGNFLIHLGSYRNRANNGDTTVNNIGSASFRVKVWK